jgi:hypothetical protein
MGKEGGFGYWEDPVGWAKRAHLCEATFQHGLRCVDYGI